MIKKLISAVQTAAEWLGYFLLAGMCILSVLIPIMWVVSVVQKF